MPRFPKISALSSGLVLLLSMSVTHSAPISFSGQLAAVDLDGGGAIYSGVPLGTLFNGAIDDQSFGGFITDGTTRTDFGCCIAAEGLTLINNHVVSQTEATVLNGLLGSTVFSAGQFADLVGFTGDVQTAAGGRFSLSLRYVLDFSAFDNEDASSYPFNPALIDAVTFNIFEDDDSGAEIYSAYGLAATTVPLPASAWLLLTGLVAVLRPARLVRRLRQA